MTKGKGLRLRMPDGRVVRVVRHKRAGAVEPHGERVPGTLHRPGVPQRFYPRGTGGVWERRIGDDLSWVAAQTLSKFNHTVWPPSENDDER